MIRVLFVFLLLQTTTALSVTPDGYRAAPVTATLVWTNHQGLSAPFAACYVAVDTGDGAVTLIDLPDDRCASLQ